jgi:hypothetical protein
MAHTDAVPEGGIPMGTVNIQDLTGALIRVEAQDPDNDAYFLMITADGIVHRLNTRKIRAALHHASVDHPDEP